ncbi:MAG: protein kinase [Gemmatimonadetes bacterium]|nr:protein kinase [Gemmatimonadota bacterium]
MTDLKDAVSCRNCATPLPDGYRFCPACGTDSSDPSSLPQADPGTSLSQLFQRLKVAVSDRYELHRTLGHGGMGAVFLATERKLDRLVAIKVLPPGLSMDEHVLARFQREARTAANLDHPNIIPIYSVEDEGDLHYFVMRYVAGHGLDEDLRAGPMPIEQCQRILWAAAGALGHAHQRGVVHRDVKPANIMIDGEGRPVLADFGISKAQGASTQFTATGQVIGTPTYMSPEQARGQPVDGRSDQYSLAMVAYRMLAGRLPFEDDSVHTVLYKHVFEDPPPLQRFRPETPAFLVQAIHRALRKEPDSRFPTMGEFAVAVWPDNPVTPTPGSGNIAIRSSAASDAKTELTPLSTTTIRKKRMLGAGGAIAVMGIAGLLWFAPGLGGEAGADPSVSGPGMARDSNPAAASVAGEKGPALPVGGGPQAAGEAPPGSRPATSAAEPAEQPAEQLAVGLLTVGSTPWGTVLIDGVEIRNTPLSRYELPPGEYVVEVRRTGYQTTVDTVTITSANPTILRKVLIQ